MASSSVTHRDIAKAVGCSQMTVSRALGESGYVRAGLREKIRRTAHRLGYRPNPMVAALMASRRQTQPTAQASNLAYLHFDPDPKVLARNDYQRALCQGARKRARELGFELIALSGAEPGMTPARLAQVLRARGVNGVLVAPLPIGEESVELEWEAFATATLGFSVRSPRLHRAGTYQYHSIPLIYEKLLELGYRRIGIGLAAQTDARVENSFEASIASLHNQRALPKPHVIRDAKGRRADPVAWIRRKRLDAYIDGGYGLHPQALRRAGFRIPQDLGYASLFGEGTTATARRDWDAIAAAAVDLVYGQLMRNERGLPAKPKTVLIEPEWVPGKTVRQQAMAET